MSVKTVLSITAAIVVILMLVIGITLAVVGSRQNKNGLLIAGIVLSIMAGMVIVITAIALGGGISL